MRKVLFLLFLMASLVWAKQLTPQEFQNLVIGVAQGEVLTKEKYSDFWEFANKQKDKKKLLAIMKNGVYTNLLLQIEFFKSVLNSYEAKQIKPTSKYTQYMADSTSLMKRDDFYYLADSEYKKMIQEYNLELSAYSPKHKEALEAAAKRKIDKGEWETTYMATKVILGNLKILFAENYNGDF
ncbi:hypothetical protein [Campylobacter sp. RM16192]|uniref:hypothetical protein n=1 Tax=Campylobacter sp. RM16192 TaxID=1660080 RepID=UPI0014517C5B|nr:hypothetical protein [Campylobacter sp. RM16192]QCD52496.1 hypothetical protein CDOMC_0873 [Campylobacter sp. RM16192]